jgi:hypothetical protein
MTVAPLLVLESCAHVIVHDFESCAPIPGGLGAVCDNFLTPHQQVLSQEAWDALQASWISQGFAVECTNSQAIAYKKEELEELCSKTPCDTEAKAQVLEGLDRLDAIGKISIKRSEEVLTTGSP